MELERIAFHEAGHAVASWLVRQHIHHATVVPDGDCLGHVAAAEELTPEAPRDRSLAVSKGWPWALTVDQERDLARWLNPIVGGAVAESLWVGRKMRLCGPDARHAATIAQFVDGDWRSTRLHLRRAWCETEAALRENWWLVARVAAALLEFQYLSGDEVDRLCRGFTIVRPGYCRRL